MRRFEFANDVEYGLTTSIFTNDITSVMRFVEDVEVGMVHVNEPTVGGEAQLPFGGTKSTGVGAREMAEEGLNFFTELKTVFINYSGQRRTIDDALGILVVLAALEVARRGLVGDDDLDRLSLVLLDDVEDGACRRRADVVGGATLRR